MRFFYRGHEIDVRRDADTGGHERMNVMVRRTADDRKVIDVVEDNAGHIREKVMGFKKIIDAEMLKPEPWSA